MIEEIKVTQEELSERVGKNRSTIANYLRLLKLDPIIQTGMRDGFISMGHGRALINVESLNDQLDIYEKVITKNLSVRSTEALVRQYKNPNERSGPIKKPLPPTRKMQKRNWMRSSTNRLTSRSLKRGKEH